MPETLKTTYKHPNTLLKWTGVKSLIKLAPTAFYQEQIIPSKNLPINKASKLGTNVTPQKTKVQTKWIIDKSLIKYEYLPFVCVFYNIWHSKSSENTTKRDDSVYNTKSKCLSYGNLIIIDISSYWWSCTEKNGQSNIIWRYAYNKH
jgi:hypothetical protein